MNRICSLALAVAALALALSTAVAQPTATPNSAYRGGINAIAVQGGGSAAEVAAVVERDSGMRVQALWMYVAAHWLFYLPSLPTVEGGLTFFPQTGAAYAVLSPRPLERVLTFADNGRTFTFRVGERFATEPGMGLVWAYRVADPSVLRSDPVIAIFPPPARISWTPIAPGQTTLEATGESLCRFAAPPCQTFAPASLFSVTIVVVQ